MTLTEEVFSQGKYTHDEKKRVAIVFFPWPSSTPYKFISEIIKILDPIASKIVLIGGNTERIHYGSTNVIIEDIGVGMHHSKEVKPKLYSMVLWALKWIAVQIKLSMRIVRKRENFDVIIFYAAYPYYLIPLLSSKIVRKKSIEVITRSKPNSAGGKLLGLQNHLLFRLLDGISPESYALIGELNLASFLEKILPAGARCIDTGVYRKKIELDQRKKVVGYVGRIVKEKGVPQFIDAIPKIARVDNTVEYVIGGTGELLGWVKQESQKLEKAYNVKIRVTGFVDESDFPNLLNELTLLVLPTSHSEGLPTIILESMACGTPVLATGAGAIMDIVENENTGFILEDTKPDTIAEGVIRAINHPELNKISDRAQHVITANYSYAMAVKRWQGIILGV